jgi:hypothetical protein
MLAFLKFDDEDTYYPPEYRLDDVSKWLAEIMTESGITGSMCVMGARARMLKERGRDDVLAAMAKHELVSHQAANVRPELVEILSDKEWHDGVDAAREYEDRVVKDFDFAWGRAPQGLSRHNVQWGPQHVALAGEKGLYYQGNLTAVPETEQPCWYAGAVCLPCHNFDPVSGNEVEITPEIGIGDMYYSCDDAFEKRFQRMQRYVDACAERGVEFIHLFGCHPSRILNRGFIEGRCLAGGLNRTPQEVGFLYGVIDADEEERVKKNFRRVCEWIRDHPSLDCKSGAEIAKAFSTQPKDISRDELTAYAEDVVQQNKILLHQTFSPAELLMGMMESLVSAGENNDLPYGVDRKNILGPVEIPTVGLEMSSVTHAELLKLCRSAIDHVESTSHLPGNLHLNGQRIGIGQLAVAVSRAYAAQTHYSRYAKLNLDTKVRYPEVAWNVDAWVRRNMMERDRFNPDMPTDKLAKHARLQTWTLKPAWLTPPRGVQRHEGRFLAS